MTMENNRVSKAYAWIVSWVFGILAFFGIFYSLRIQLDGTSINFALSLILPMLISLAWGHRYGLLSITLGLVFLYPFILGPSNGWASLVPMVSLFLWIGIHGYGSQMRKIKKTRWNNLYVLQFWVILVKLALYLVLFPLLIKSNPPFWYGEAYTSLGMDVILLFAIKGIIVDTILLALCDAILLMPMVRKLFRLPISKGSRYNTSILLGMVIFGMLFTMMILYTTNVIVNQGDSITWLLTPDNGTKVTLSLSVLLFGVMGGIAVRFLQRNQETQLTLEKRNRQYSQMIRKIHGMNEVLEQRVEERTKALKEAMGELEEFSYGVSHDLKSPVRAVAAYSDMVLEDNQNLGEDSQVMIRNIKDLCTRMTDLINKILEYSTMAKKSLDIKPLEVDRILTELFYEYTIANPARKIYFSLEGKSPVIYGDEVLIRDAFSNLLSNGVKFTRNREFAEISVQFKEEKQKNILVFRDNGVGFEMKNQNKLFTIFQRLHSSEEFEGSGIGLVLVKKIILSHGGEIWMNSILGTGTTVFVSFPKLEVDGGIREEVSDV